MHVLGRGLACVFLSFLLFFLYGALVWFVASVQQSLTKDLSEQRGGERYSGSESDTE